MQVLQSIKNCESSLACAKWMVTKLPLGSEKVLVLKHCVKLAELWHQSITEEVCTDMLAHLYHSYELFLDMVY